MASLPTTDAVWTQLSTDLRRFIRRRVPDEHIADDLVQETFARVHRHLRGLQDTERLAAWVYKIARNVVHDHFRKRTGQAVSLGELDPPSTQEEDSRPSRCPSATWLVEMIRQLPLTYREAVQLVEIEGLTQAETAKRLELSVPAAKSRVQRGRKLLRQALEACCRFDFDRRGNLMQIVPRAGRTACRDCGD